MVDWISEHEDLHSAELALDARRTINLIVESLGEAGWDWQAWDTAGRVQQRFGLGNSLVEAKQSAEAAAYIMLQLLGLAAGAFHPTMEK